MNKFVNFFYPPRCQLCGCRDHLLYAGQLCASCAGDLRSNETPCQVCAVPMSLSHGGEHQQSSICGYCTKISPIYDFCWSPFIYSQPLEWMIQQLKFNAKLHFAPLLSNLMEEKICHNPPQHLLQINKPEVIIPMPLHNRRLKLRGFNQSYLLIKPVAKRLDLPIDLNSCERVRDTEHQTGKNARQRQQNIKNAFVFNNKHSYQHVAIFDDVVTTGSSVSELSKELKKGGVKRVDVWCLARSEKN